MFTVKDTRPQHNTFASTPKNRDRRPARMQSAEPSLDSLYLMQRNLGNSYLQATHQLKEASSVDEVDFAGQQTERANKTGLPDQLKAGIENLSGLAMDDVRVHYNSLKPTELQALAYTQGTEIHLGPGQEQHLPHEAWHVVQQAQVRVKPTMQMKDDVYVNDDKGLEDEANVMGDRAVRPESRPPAVVAREIMRADTLGQPRTHAVAPAIRHPGRAQTSLKVVQCTKEHNENFKRRITHLIKDSTMTDSKKKELMDDATALDKSDVSTHTFDPHIKKDKTQHPHWFILKHAKHLYEELEKQRLAREYFRWFQVKDKNLVKQRGMRARLYPGKKDFMTGSNTAGKGLDDYFNAPALDYRKNSNGSALYIKGHLLNDNLGGVGRTYNLVPLTAEKKQLNNWTGSNDANGEHNKKVEEPIKKLLTGSSQIKEELYYRVDSLVPAPPPARLEMTTKVQKYADDFKAEQAKPQYAKPKVSPHDVCEAVESANLTLKGIGPQLLSAVKGHSTTPGEASTRLSGNADLWQLENTRVPEGIVCTAYYFEDDGSGMTVQKYAQTPDLEDINKFKIRNILPEKYTAPYKKS